MSEEKNKNIEDRSQNIELQKEDHTHFPEDLHAPKPEKMDTHAHHLHKAPGKKWTHYLFEFFMLFLAVFCGFLAENIREHKIERDKEKEYIRSLVEDLKADTSSLSGYAVNQRIALESYDSVIFLLDRQSKTVEEQKRLYYLVRTALRFNDFPQLNENTYEQMKSSGNLRLLHKPYVADSIFRYYFKLKEIGLTTSQLLLRQQSLLEIEGELFSGSTFQNMVNKKTFQISEPEGNIQLITDDKRTINECMVATHYLFSLTLYSLNAIQQHITEASGLILFLNKEYHFDE